MTWPLIQNTLLVSASVTLIAVMLGLAAALTLCCVPRFLRHVILALAVLSLAMPPFLVTNAWMHHLGITGTWRSWLPLDIFSPAGAVLVLTLMLWPIPALVTWSAWQRLEPEHLEAEPGLRGQSLIRHLLLPMAARPLSIGALITAVLAANNFAVPALLQVKVYPAQMWLSFSSTFWVKPDGSFDWVAAIGLSWPLVLLPLLLLVWMVRREFPWPALRGGTPAPRFRRALGGPWMVTAMAVTVGTCLLAVGVPMLQLAGSAQTWLQLPEAVAAGQRTLLNSFGIAATVATLCVSFALLSVLPTSRRQFKCRDGATGRCPSEDKAKPSVCPRNPVFQICRRDVGSTLLWLPFLVPGVLIGIALIQLLNHPLTAWFHQSIGVVLLALGVRYLAVGWSMARHALRTADSDLTEAAQLDGANRWQKLRFVLWPQIAPKLAAAWYVTFLLCLWDVETLVLIIPPGGETLALRVFNLLHYGHTAHVNALCLMLLGLAIAPLLVVAALVRVRTLLRSQRFVHALTRLRRGFDGQASVAAVTAAILLVGCSSGSHPDSTPVDSRFFDRVQIIATRGVGPGEVNKPRSVTVGKDDSLYVLDFTGRVQRFSPEGEFLLFWQMPETKRGNPKGLSVDNDGNILVTEPHYCRVNLFTPEGRLLAQWGEQGTNAGQLSFPRAAVVNSSDELFVSEFQLVERVQRFAIRPDADGNPSVRFLNEFGVRGDAPGEFSRAEGLFVDEEDRVVVADACNHRIQVFDAEGRFLCEFGRAGSAAGELSYPYDVCVDAERRHYVCEFGNSRVQIFDAAGNSLEVLGGPGAAPGLFNNPWGVALDSNGNLYVADSQNHRVQKFFKKSGTRTQSSTKASDAVGNFVAQSFGPCKTPTPLTQTGQRPVPRAFEVLAFHRGRGRWTRARTMAEGANPQSAIFNRQS